MYVLEKNDPLTQAELGTRGSASLPFSGGQDHDPAPPETMLQVKQLSQAIDLTF